MLKASQFRLVGIQAAIFTPNLAEFSQAKLLGSVLARYSHRYDGPVEAVTLPNEVPPQAPRVTLKSQDDVWRLQAAPARTDSFWARPTTSWLDPQQEELADEERVIECAEVLEHVTQTTGIRVGRLALVLNRLCTADNPAEEMIAHFAHAEVRRSAFRRSAGFEVHNLERYPLPSGPIINSWVRCRSAVVTANQQPAIAVEQDLNTLEEDALKHRFSPDAIRDYFARSAAEAAAILSLYFPEGEW